MRIFVSKTNQLRLPNLKLPKASNRNKSSPKKIRKRRLSLRLLSSNPTKRNLQASTNME